VGYDAVDVPALTRRRIPLMVIGTANSVTVAELAMFHMMTLAKRGPVMSAIVQESRWSDKFAERPIELSQKTLLVVGFGRIGTRIARRCLAMDMAVLVYDPYVAGESIRAAGCEQVDDLDAALPRADVVTLHCPKTRETTGLIDAARLKRMKPSAFLVNTARGGIVDEAALHAALTAGTIAGAGLDVFEKEPAPKDHPLFALANVSLSPMSAAARSRPVSARRSPPCATSSASSTVSRSARTSLIRRCWASRRCPCRRAGWRRTGRRRRARSG